MTRPGEETLELKDYAIIGAITLAVLAFFPLLAVMGLTLQFGFLIVAPILAISALVYAFGSVADNSIRTVHGVTVPMGVLFHQGHTWVKESNGRAVRAGIDDFAQRLVGRAEVVVSSDVGEQVEAGQLFALIKHNGRSIGLRSPVSGTVKKVNALLNDDPTLVNREPYGRGWLMEVEPETSSLAAEGLAKGKAAVSWMRRELDRLAALVSAPEARAASLPDGGELVMGVSDDLDDETWQRVTTAFFP